MPSAASQLISLDLFSSGQRNGFDLASSCYGSFSLLDGYDMLDLSALAMLEFLWDFNSTREYSSHLFPITLETYALFLPACEPKRMQMDHLALGNDSSKDAEKRSGGLVNAWAHPDIQCISLPRSSSSAYYLSTFPVMFDATPGYIRWWALVELR